MKSLPSGAKVAVVGKNNPVAKVESSNPAGAPVLTKGAAFTFSTGKDTPDNKVAKARNIDVTLFFIIVKSSLL